MTNNYTSSESIVSSLVRDFYSPTKEEKEFVEQEYERLDKILEGKIFQSGSYARYTAITPLNDLDVIWILSEENKKQIISGDLNLKDILNDFAVKLKDEYNKTGVRVKTEAQEHSVRVEFVEKEGDFTIDVTPARELSEDNEFGYPLYKIPEIDTSGDVVWVKSDPKGYIELAKRVNNNTPNFRKATKLLKAWRRAWKHKKNFGNVEFKLKSFHLELIIQDIIKKFPDYTILDIVNCVFYNIENIIGSKNYPDRAGNRYVDDYIDELTGDQKRIIKIASKSGAILLQKIQKKYENAEMVETLHKLASGEEFIEAYGYDISANKLTTPIFCIEAIKNENQSSYKSGIVNLENGDSVKFKAVFLPNFHHTKSKISKYFYKVTNTGDDALKVRQLRGEINLGSTLNTTESAVFRGTHFVECFGVNDQVRSVLAYAICTVVIDDDIATK
ncbi:MAG: hypothetical protein Q8K92_12150 [Leadbetterella sp.]|nr:hypothetical protein [Leadbetterella sp.]